MDERIHDNMAAAFREIVGDAGVFDTGIPGRFVFRTTKFDPKKAYREGQALLSQNMPNKAKKVLKEAVAGFVGPTFLTESMPLAARRKEDGFKCETYVRLAARMEDIAWLFCLCGMIGKCYVQRDKKMEALKWFEEVHIIREHIRQSHSPPLHGWHSWSPQLQEFYDVLVSVSSEQAKIYLSLCNSALALYHAQQGPKIISAAGPTMNIEQMSQFLTAEKVTIRDYSQHPVPTLMTNAEITESTLQVRGSWEKINLPRTSTMPPRQVFIKWLPSFFAVEPFSICVGYLYVVGGREKDLITKLRDFWRISLQRLDKWEKLPSIPQKFLPKFEFIVACHYANRVYVYAGFKDICVFDIESQRWHFIKTRGTYKYPDELINDFRGIIANGKMYIFGGDYPASPAGCNLLHSLDLKTMEWEYLDGDVVADEANYDVPGPRRYVTMWPARDEETIFIMFGDACRDYANMLKHKFGSFTAYEYSDFWSYRIAKKTLRITCDSYYTSFQT